MRTLAEIYQGRPSGAGVKWLSAIATLVGLLLVPTFALVLLIGLVVACMSSHLVEDCRNVIWLLWQATLNYTACLPIVLLSVWCLLDARNDRRSLMILSLPIFWISPAILAGAFTDWSASEAKTANWVGLTALIAFTLQILISIYLIRAMKGRRWLAVIGGFLNGTIGLLALWVVAMDSSGDWI